MDRTLQGHGQHRIQDTERRQANQKHNTENYKEKQLGQKQKHRGLVTHIHYLGLCEQFLEVKNHIFTSLKDSTFIIFVFFSSDYQCVLKHLTSSHTCRLITPSRYVLYTSII